MKHASKPNPNHGRWAPLLTVAALLAACGGGSESDATHSFTLSASRAGADSAACDTRVNNTHDKLLQCVTLAGVRSHQAALQEIADANNGIRTSGTPGYDASVEYAVQVFTAAGYQVTVQPFQFQTFIVLSPSASSPRRSRSLAEPPW